MTKHNVGDLVMYTYNTVEGEKINDLGMITDISRSRLYRIYWLKEERLQSYYAEVDLGRLKKDLETYMNLTRWMDK